MAGKSRKRGRSAGNSNRSRSEQTKGWADVAIRLIDVMYDLAQTGNLVGLIIIGFLAWVLIVTLKLPETSIESFFGDTGRFLISERFYLFPLASALAVSVITNFIQEKVYKAHIQELTEHRSLLVHGLETGELKPLKKHRTSGFDVQSGTMNNGKGDD